MAALCAASGLRSRLGYIHCTHALSTSLGIPNAIHSHGGAASLSDIVTRLSPRVPQHRRPCLPRLMRFLAGTGILAHDHHDDAATGIRSSGAAGDDGVYRLTPMSRLLVDDATVNGCTGLSPLVLSQTTSYHVAVAQHLSEWFTTITDVGLNLTDETPFQMAYGGMGPWEAARSDARFNEVFNAGMETDSPRWSTWLEAIARAFPHVKCSVLDLPHVISSILQPPDDDATLILTQCKKAICSHKPTTAGGGGGKVIIMDVIVGSPCKKAMFEAQVSLDLLMMAVTSGKERDEDEWRKIFMDAGFRRYEARPLLGILSIIDLYPLPHCAGTLRRSLPPGLADAEDHPQDHLKVQALLAKEQKPKGQYKHGLHVAQDLKGYSREPPDADELAQINTNRDEA
ncbi:hypothetical protein HU200_030715 [Digitaria exilis]|uniref:O-methyltransferase ZRP4 n=1 Tax=Digitaria exilis TaxID=1010633 RepID=A0A835BQX5_9POAL|nr:hypothetical protein HU200_030715 [Digitaria exilis]